MPYLRPFYRVDSFDWVFNSHLEQNESDSLTMRELVRQWMIQEIINTYQYPKDWIHSRILPILPDTVNLSSFKGNILGFYVLTANLQPFLWVIITNQGEAEQGELLLRDILLGNYCSGLGIITDGTLEYTRFIRRRFNSNKCEYIIDLEVYVSPKKRQNSQLFTLNALDSIQNKKNNYSKLITLSQNIENIFFEIHSNIRDIDGMHADEALDELCKIIYTKLYDEERASNSTKNCELQKNLYGSTEELAASVRYIYKEANEYDTRVFRLKIPEYERSRGVFNIPLRLSSPALWKVVEHLQEYTLLNSDTDIKGRAFQKVIAPTIRSGLGQYFTPVPIIQFMVDVMSPSVYDLILDPFCGSGHFLTTCLQFVKKRYGDKSDKQFHEFAFGKLHGIEKSDRMVRIAMTDMRLQGDGHSNIRCTDALLDLANYPDLQAESFDIILTNPPFGSLLGEETIKQLGVFELTQNQKKIPLEILGIERCLQFLRPNGRLGIIIPDGHLANKKSKFVRQWLENQGKIRGIISLPIETFSPFGANIKTSILFLRKWGKTEEVVKNHSVFLGKLDNIGYDAAYRLRGGSELNEMSQLFQNFLEKEGW